MIWLLSTRWATIGTLPNQVGEQRDASPTPSSWGGKPSGATQGQIQEVALMKEVLSQMGTSPKMPFRFMWSSRLPSVCSLCIECQWACPVTPDIWTPYCIHIRVTLPEGMGTVEATVCTMQEGHRAMADALMEKKTKPRGSGHPKGSRRATWLSTATCNIDN